jgi:flagellum-specific ATP synthase
MRLFDQSLFQETFKKALQTSYRHISVNPLQIYGSVTALHGALIECIGISKFLSIGDVCYVEYAKQKWAACEVVDCNFEVLKLLPFEASSGFRVGNRVRIGSTANFIYPSTNWKGRIINALGHPVDGKGRLQLGKEPYAIDSPPPPFHVREKVGNKISLGTKAIDVFVPCCFGQRLGIFAGSGVGKSTLVAMLARYASVDIKVIGLIGERSREVKEFIDDYLGEEGLSKSVIVVSTGDQSPTMRKRAAYLTMSVAEYFRDQGMEVLCVIDSLTRFAAARREIGLMAGELPVSKGYTPSVFSELPKLLERAGPGSNGKSITGLFTVLVEGDYDPLTEALKAILDGHIMLSKEVAERNRFPAVDVLKSISRMTPACYSKDELLLVEKARKIIALYSSVEDLIRLGVYKSGTDANIDLAIGLQPKLEGFLSQAPNESSMLEASFDLLSEILKCT